MAVEIRTTKEIVRTMLENFPKLRDNDERLICNIWIEDLKKRGVNYKMLFAEELMKHFAAGNLTNQESIRRCRQKLQQDHVELRGRTYGDRRNKQNEIKEELGYFDGK